MLDATTTAMSALCLGCSPAWKRPVQFFYLKCCAETRELSTTAYKIDDSASYRRKPINTRSSEADKLEPQNSRVSQSL